MRYEFRVCENEACQFRFPAEQENARRLICPLCGAKTAVIPIPPLNQNQPEARQPQAEQRLPLILLLDNIRSLHNVGAIFRTADGVGIGQLLLCGITATPENPRLARTALGAEQTVGWTYERNAVQTAVRLKQQGHPIWALEEGKTATSTGSVQAVSLLNTPIPKPTQKAAVLILGNENAGVDPGLIPLCDQMFSLPMVGQKRSLNVSVACGTAAYHLRHLWVSE